MIRGDEPGAGLTVADFAVFSCVRVRWPLKFWSTRPRDLIPNTAADLDQSADNLGHRCRTFERQLGAYVGDPRSIRVTSRGRQRRGVE
jgi:hypothetical protein